MSRRPPESIVFLARMHVAMGAVILAFTVTLFLLLDDSAVLELSRKTYGITIGLSVLYLVTGGLVWFGVPPARVFNYVCSLLYLARPPLGMRVWKIIRSEEYRQHFRRGR